MDWEKVKKIVIIFLVILNCGLYFLNYIERQKYVLSKAQENAIYKVLEKNNIGLYTNILNNFSPKRELIVSTKDLDIEHIKSIFFNKEETKTNVEFDKVTLTSETKNLEVKNNNISLTWDNRKNYIENFDKNTAIDIAKDFIKKLGVYGNLELDSIEKYEDYYIFYYYEKFKNSKVFTNNNILIVDDEDGIRDIIKQYLKFEGYTFDEAANGKDAVDMFFAQKFDLVVMDVMMPFIDGISALRMIREKSNTPVILLTAKGEEYDKIFGFDLGADDYMVKPFSPKELMSRIKAVLKRVVKPEIKTEIYRFKDLEINPSSYEVKINGDKIPLTPKEFELLLFFIQNKGKALTREDLLTNIWDYGFYGDSRTVDTHIKMLRNNLGDYRDLIKTVWGVGYRYDD